MPVDWIEGQGARIPGHNVRRAAARAQLAEHLKAQRGRSDVEAEDEAEDAQVVRAWWGGDAVGFVNAEHPGAQPVTVLNLPAAIPQEARRGPVRRVS